jgi:hypothetical protein
MTKKDKKITHCLFYGELKIARGLEGDCDESLERLRKYHWFKLDEYSIVSICSDCDGKGYTSKLVCQGPNLDASECCGECYVQSECWNCDGEGVI